MSATNDSNMPFGFTIGVFLGALTGLVGVYISEYQPIMDIKDSVKYLNNLEEYRNCVRLEQPELQKSQCEQLIPKKEF